MCSRKFSTIQQDTNHQVIPVIATLTKISPNNQCPGKIYGTRDSMSYLVSNALALNKRHQRIDIAAQLQYGIRVFDLNVRFEKSDRSACFKTDRHHYTELITINGLDTDFSLWHVFEILNCTAGYLRIAKLIIVISFFKSTSLIDEQAAQLGFWEKIKDSKFDHLFITLKSHLPKWLVNTEYKENAIDFFVRWHLIQKNTLNFLNRERLLIAMMIEKIAANSVQDTGESNVQLIWLDEFDPFASEAS